MTETTNRYELKYAIWWKPQGEFSIPSGRLNLMVWDKKYFRCAYQESLK